MEIHFSSMNCCQTNDFLETLSFRKLEISYAQ
jgi:hypothetical protein